MRAREILDEDYDQNLESDLSNLLIGAKGSGSQEVSTQDLAAQLTNMGYSVDINSLILLLSRNPAVTNATPTVVSMTTQDTESSNDQSQDSGAVVSDMAQNAAKKAMK